MKTSRGMQDLYHYTEDFLIKKNYIIFCSSLREKYFSIMCKTTSDFTLFVNYSERNRFTYVTTHNEIYDSICDCLCAQLNHFFVLFRGL